MKTSDLKPEILDLLLVGLLIAGIALLVSTVLYLCVELG